MNLLPPPNLCPVCRRVVKPTAYRNIPSHMDSIGREECRASGYPFRITVISDPEQMLRATA